MNHINNGIQGANVNDGNIVPENDSKSSTEEKDSEAAPGTLQHVSLSGEHESLDVANTEIVAPGPPISEDMRTEDKQHGGEKTTEEAQPQLHQKLFRTVHLVLNRRLLRMKYITKLMYLWTLLPVLLLWLARLRCRQE